MAIKSFTRSTIENNIFYRSMLAGNAFYNPSDEDILAEEVLTSSQASVTFSNLVASYGSTYQHLQIRAVAQHTTGGLDTDYMRINGVSTNSYSWHQLRGNGSTVSSIAGSTTDKMFVQFVGDDTNKFGVAIIDILDPFETTKYTTIRSFTGGEDDAGGKLVGLLSGLYQATTAVDSISINASTGSLNTGSRFTLIGL